MPNPALLFASSEIKKPKQLAPVYAVAPDCKSYSWITRKWENPAPLR
jgi:hypothetical protein